MTTDSLDSRPQPRIETYIPLYRKYRPQLFADLVGQEAISQTLGNAINLNKVAHAYLFCGPRGTGKTSTARIFAKSLNCEQGPTVSPCLQCASCTGITQGNALDVIEFDAASNNGVNDARELIENCQYSSMTGRFKVYIIDEVHMLTSQAFNALLKTLEEPPANVIFIFATTEAHKVLPTIISRCQRFDFNRITTENIVSRLRYVAQQESIAIDEEALLMIGRHARGGLRDAVGLLDQVSVLGRTQTDKVIGRKDVALFIGNLEEDLLLRLAGAIAERRATDLLQELSELLNRGIEPIQLLKDLTVHFRNLLLVQASGANADPELLSLPPDYFQQLAQQAGLFPQVEELPQIIGRLSAVERNVRNSSQPQLWLEVGLIELAYRYEIHLVQALAERIEKLEAQLSGGGVPVSPPLVKPGTVPAPQALSSTPIAAQALKAPIPSAPVSQAFSPKPSASSNPSLAFDSLATNSTIGSTLKTPKQTPSVTSKPLAEVAQALPVDSNQSGVGVLTDPLDTLYFQICAAVRSPNLRARLKDMAFPIRLEENLLIVGCIGDKNFIELQKNDNLVHLRKAIEKVLGKKDMPVQIILEEKRPTGLSAPEASLAASAPPPTNSPLKLAGLSAPLTTEPEQAVQPFLGSRASEEETIGVAIAVAEKPATSVATPAAMPKLERPALPPLDFSAPPPVGNLPTVREELPPMDVGEPPPFLDDEEPYSAQAAVPEKASPTVVGLAGDSDLSEAKKHAVELFQGRIVE